jgi:hypothetical protein
MDSLGYLLAEPLIASRMSQTAEKATSKRSLKAKGAWRSEQDEDTIFRGIGIEKCRRSIWRVQFSMGSFLGRVLVLVYKHLYI